MRAALISMTGQPRGGEGGAPLALAGKTLARRQLEFALAAGCECIVMLGDGASAEAIALRHTAEAAGARFQTIRDSHGLLGMVRATDQLLVLAPGLLPDTELALAALGQGNAVLVLPAAAGVAAGFERIDLERAWAGVAVIPGAKVERLAELPADSEPTSALLRIALQAKVAERRLPDEVLADESWAMIREGEAPVVHEHGWLNRHLPLEPPHAPSRWLARLALRPLALRLLARREAAPALAGGTALLLAGAVAAAAYGFVPLGFGLLTLGVLLGEFSVAFGKLRHAPFGRRRSRWTWGSVLPFVVDAALLACAVLAIDGTALHRLFPPLVLLGGLYARPSAHDTEFLHDRGVLAALFAIASGFGFVEPAIMLAALALIGLAVTKSGAWRG